MADCFPPESDDLHRRWLPREILADIGIVDSESAVVTEPTPEAAAAAAVEAVAAQLAGILGGGGANKVWPLAPPPPTPPPHASLAADPCHGAMVCGLEGNVVVSCGAGTTTNGGGGGGGAMSSWPSFVPYPQQLQWQVGGSGLVNHGGVLDYPLLPHAALPCHLPPPANLRAGTGVFLPRVDKYRYPSTPATPKGGAWAGGAVAKPSSWAAAGAGTGTGTGSRPATGKKQQPQPQPQPQTVVHATPTPPTKQQHQKVVATGGALALALPQDWSYR